MKLRAIRRLFFLCIVLVGAASVAAPSSLPDFTSQLSREAAVVVSITTVSLGYSVSEAGPEVKEAHGAALRAGIGAGDQILGVNHALIRSVADYDAALSRLPYGGVVAVLVVREGRHRYYAVDPGQPTR